MNIIISISVTIFRGMSFLVYKLKIQTTAKKLIQVIFCNIKLLGHGNLHTTEITKERAIK